MKKSSIIVISIAVLITVRTAVAASLSAKLPYASGQRFVVTQGYDTPPTHIKKDDYALDFTQAGCDAYGARVVAAASGNAMFVGQEGYNGGYGTELIINHGKDIVSRYAHMIPGSITVVSGGAIRQGQAVGLVGDTGLVAGAACGTHPGTHLHFAMDVMNDGGMFSAYDPEPISGYDGVIAGKWYRSDNGEEDAVSASAPGEVLGAYDVATSSGNVTPVAASSTIVVLATTTVPLSALSLLSSPSINGNVPLMGGVSAIPGVAGVDAGSSLLPSPLEDNRTSTDITTDTVDATNTLAVATSTAGTPSSTATSSVHAAIVATGTLFAQFGSDARSPVSWYDDNWFELGNGFSGTLTALTLEGAVSDVDYLSSHVSLQEFKDKDYAVLVREFPISGNAPFTPAMATATFSGLSIPLKPYFYYRLATDQDYQNRSVVLAGTATTTTGTAMWNNFIYGAGRVEYTEPFFPFMVMDGIAATSTLVPPPLTTPANIVENFDTLGMQVELSWSTSTDPDWPADPLHYEMNYSTSTVLSEDGWHPPGPIPVAMGNSYLIGVRAANDYGDVSAAATATWDFPAGFSPYILGPEMGYASQYFTAPSTSTLQSIQLFTANVRTGARYIESVGCSLQVFDEYGSSSLGMTPSDNGFGGFGCAGAPIYSFASSSLVLHPDHRYHWVFVAQTGNPSTGASVQFYGTATDTAGGPFSDPALTNAKFTVTGDAGVLFSN